MEERKCDLCKKPDIRTKKALFPPTNTFWKCKSWCTTESWFCLICVVNIIIIHYPIWVLCLEDALNDNAFLLTATFMLSNYTFAWHRSCSHQWKCTHQKTEGRSSVNAQSHQSAGFKNYADLNLLPIWLKYISDD